MPISIRAIPKPPRGRGKEEHLGEEHCKEVVSACRVPKVPIVERVNSMEKNSMASWSKFPQSNLWKKFQWPAGTGFLVNFIEKVSIPSFQRFFESTLWKDFDG